jgi:Arc/MetJ-type ribon-helix-helix transcriptional regulator
MGYSRTDYYESIIQRQIRAGRASNKSEVIHQALALLDAVTRGNGPEGAGFRNADELEALLLQARPAAPMTAERKARIYGTSKAGSFFTNRVAMVWRSGVSSMATSTGARNRGGFFRILLVFQSERNGWLRVLGLSGLARAAFFWILAQNDLASGRRWLKWGR